MSTIQQPRSLDEVLGSNLAKQVSGPSHDAGKKALDIQITGIFGSEYMLSSSHFFTVSADVSWIAISRNVENQMSEHSVRRAHYDKENPGVVLVDFYRQPHGAFVLAMDGTRRNQDDKLVGYFILQPKHSH